jgi:site-specific DNA-methyltransferase (adenine-specific)
MPINYKSIDNFPHALNIYTLPIVKKKMLRLNEIYLGDCLDLMSNIDDKSVDMILCDLPYGTTACKWDSIIPFEPLWNQYKRIIKDNGTIVLTSMQPFTSALVMSNIKMFKYDWIWKKPKGTGHLNAKKQPLRDKEDILVFAKGQTKYNPQFSEGKPYKNKAGKNHSGTNSRTDSYGKYSDFRYDNPGKRYPKQVIECGVVERGTLHPTQKPVELFEYLIRTYTDENDLVLDNCAGSGTTGVACKNLNRNYILMEKDPSYFEIAKNRLTP